MQWEGRLLFRGDRVNLTIARKVHGNSEDCIMHAQRIGLELIRDCERRDGL